MREDFEDVYLRHSSTVYRIGLMFFKNIQEAEDIVHDVFVKFAFYGGKFNGEQHLKAWLITVAQNTCRTLYSKNKRLVPLLENYSYNESVDDVLSEVMKLKKEDRLAIYMFYYEGYSSKEIAELTNSTDTAVRARLKRARRQLKINLED